MFRKGLVFVIVVLFTITGFGSAFNVEQFNESKTLNRDWLYVGGSGPGNYTTIQSAINAANTGDTVFVYSGIYYENIVVDKTINLIGESEETTIIDAQGYGNTVTLTASNIKITHIKITGGESSSTYNNFGLGCRMISFFFLLCFFM